jgi:hypothetical protein
MAIAVRYGGYTEEAGEKLRIQNKRGLSDTA